MRDRWAVAGFVTGLVTFCGFGLVSGHHLAPATVISGGLVAGAAFALAVRAVRHGLLVTRLRRVSDRTSFAGVEVRSLPMRDAAFVAGLSRPTIFCDQQLPEQLTERQLRAVVLHERAHQESWDPTRLLLLELVAPVARRLRWGREWLVAALARREIAADDHAMANGARRSDLAGALLRLPPLAQAHVAGFGSAVDLRLRALLGDDPAVELPSRVRRRALLVTGALAGALACTLVLHLLFDRALAVLACC